MDGAGVSTVSTTQRVVSYAAEVCCRCRIAVLLLCAGPSCCVCAAVAAASMPRCHHAVLLPCRRAAATTSWLVSAPA